ncbi:MAG: hypothetical protein ABL931_03810 [Usitatibacteraceae bacterium]
MWENTYKPLGTGGRIEPKSTVFSALRVHAKTRMLMVSRNATMEHPDMNNSRHFEPLPLSNTQPRVKPPVRARNDMRTRLLHRLQDFFEVSRDQFDEVDLRIPEWVQADAALERTYDACAAREAMAAVQQLCLMTRRHIEMAVETSIARSYYDGRI